MRKILTAIIALVSLIASVPIVTPTELLPGQVAASVNVQPTCDVKANPTSINFGPMVPNAIVDGTGQDVAVSQDVGNTDATLTVYGLDWTGGTGMSVDQTHWDTSSTTYGTMTTLKLSGFADTVDPSLTPLESHAVHFGLQVPAHQAVASYSQTITFAVAC